MTTTQEHPVNNNSGSFVSPSRRSTHRRISNTNNRSTETVGTSSNGVATYSSGESDTTSTPADLNTFVDDLLEEMNTRFSEIGMSILGRMDEMGSRIDELEKTIASLSEQAGLDRESIQSGSVGAAQQQSRIKNESASLTSGGADFSPILTATGRSPPMTRRTTSQPVEI